MDNDCLAYEQIVSTLKIIEQCTDDYMYIFDFDNDIYSISSSATQAFALKDAQFAQASAVLNNVFYPEDIPAISKDLQLLKNGSKSVHNMEYRWLDSYGNPVWISCRGVVVKEKEKPRYLVGRIRELGKQNKIDKVTGLYQSDVLKEKVRFMNEISSYPAAIMIIGPDGFKNINEWHGTAVGDRVMERIARIIEKVVKNRAQVYRLDGDLFAVFVYESSVVGNREYIKDIYKDVRSCVDAMLEESGYNLFFTLSAGTMFFNTGKTDIDTAVNRAKFALHQAKLHGKNMYVEYSEETYENYIRNLDIQGELRKDIQNNFHGFAMYFQPIVSSLNGKLYGAEALLRWNSDKYGLLSPAMIIPILEESGLIIPLGKWIVQEAAKQCLEWQKVYPDFRMNINLSFIQLLKSDVVKDTMERIDEVGVSHRNIVFEITESGQLESNHNTRNILNSFADKNFQLAIDDFGTGYSNLRYVKDMMFGLIKIDRLFIQNIHQSEYNYMIVKNVTDMAHSLNMKVCVEGVETQEELDCVLRLKPDCIQGYYYNKPMTAEEFTAKYVLSGAW